MDLLLKLLWTLSLEKCRVLGVGVRVRAGARTRLGLGFVLGLRKSLC